MKLPRRQLVTTDDADKVTQQPVSPCPDCPFTRSSLQGWLGGDTPEAFLIAAHSDQVMLCHAVKLCGGKRVQCAGAAIFRRNVVKGVFPPNIELPGDKVKVFANDMEFAAHHMRRAVTSEEVRILKFKRMSANIEKHAGKRKRR